VNPDRSSPSSTDGESTGGSRSGGRGAAIIAISILGLIFAATVVVVLFAVRGEGSTTSSDQTLLVAQLPVPPTEEKKKLSERVAGAVEQAKQHTPLAPCEEEAIVGTVNEVVSATTIRVTTDDCSATVHYAAVRGFESGNPEGEASARNVTLVFGRTVVVEPDVTGITESGAHVAHVFVDGILVTEQLVRLGVLRIDPESTDTLYADRLLTAQEEAQNAQRGGWYSDACSTSPEITSSTDRSEFVGQVEITAINPRGEVVTIHNVSTTTIDVSEWILVASDFPSTFKFPSGTTLQPAGSLQIVSGVAGAPSDRLFWTSDKVWRDDKTDSAKIFDSSDRLVCLYAR